MSTANDSMVINGTADEVGHEVAVRDHAPTTLFRTDDPVEVVEKAARVADALKDVIVRKGLFTLIQGKAHIGVEGWQLVGAMLGVTAVCVHTEPVDGGYLATVEARTSDGRVIGRADALCTKHEKRGPWKQADDYARLSMAQTRATSKALKGPLGFVVSLAGYATTPAEEMTFAEPDPVQPSAAATVPPDPIGRDDAVILFDQAHKAGIPADKLQLAASHAAKRDVGPCDTKAKALTALGSLTEDEAMKVASWITKKAAEAKG